MNQFELEDGYELSEFSPLTTRNQIHFLPRNIEEGSNRDRKMFLCCKRVVDVCAAIVGLILLTPVFLLIAFAIKCDSRGSVFYAHNRVGKDGKQFMMYKFRTMVQESEEAFKQFSPELKKMFYEKYKLDDDPRITRIGKFLRKTSLDELPQLFNLFLGNMSLVGPRPVLAAELLHYGQSTNEFLSMKPGITGYWQAHGRSNTTYEQRVELELYYIEHASLILDIKILFRTIMVVFCGYGAK